VRTKTTLLIGFCAALMGLFSLTLSAQAASSKKGDLEGTLIVTAPSRSGGIPTPSTNTSSTDEYGNAVNNSAPTTAVSHAAPEEVVIYLEKVPGHYKAPKKHVDLDQKYLRFNHRVLAVLKGTTVDFTNHDPVYHNIFTNSQLNKFDLGKKAAGQVASAKLNHVEVPVKVYCEIHSSMKTNILVLQNPYFATVKPGEKFSITGIPAGTYTLIAWHDYWEPVEQTVKIKKGSTTQIKITMDKVRE
jgi:plastocyanin